MREYIDRAEQLKQLLKPPENPLETTSLQKLGELHIILRLQNFVSFLQFKLSRGINL